MWFDTWNLNSPCLVEEVPCNCHWKISIIGNVMKMLIKHFLPNYLINNTACVILCTWFQDAADHCIYLSKVGVSVFPSDKLGLEIFCNN